MTANGDDLYTKVIALWDLKLIVDNFLFEIIWSVKYEKKIKILSQKNGIPYIVKLCWYGGRKQPVQCVICAGTTWLPVDSENVRVLEKCSFVATGSKL
jgi:hypothetical protein